jgi:hypothetical protein
MLKYVDIIKGYILTTSSTLNALLPIVASSKEVAKVGTLKPERSIGEI